MTAGARALLVGAGNWAQQFYAPLVSRASYLDSCAIWSRSTGRARDLAARFGMRVQDDLQSAAESADIVIFAVTPRAQADLAARIARPGVKFVLEKPLAPDAVECRALVEAVRAANVPVLHMLTYRFMPDFVALLEKLQSVSVRHVELSYRSSLYCDPIPGWRGPGTVLLDLGPHLLDLVSAIAGPISEVRAEYVAGHEIWCRLTHRDGATSSVLISPRDPSYSRRLMTLEVTTASGCTVTETETAFVRDARFSEYLDAALRRFCLEGNAVPGLGVDDGRLLMEVVDATQSALSTGRCVSISNQSENSEVH
ncbi:Gfo/Idh/MocA family protein [Nocardia beijingensis]